MDPQVQIFARRVLQVRRTACKRPETAEIFRRTLTIYATKHRRNGRWPKCFRSEDDDALRWQQVYPDEQPHPSIAEFEKNWDDDISTMGPIGLLIESAIWHGINIDSNFKLWQTSEEPISIMEVPYQNLKPLVMKAAGRARNRAEWHRGVSSRRGRAPLEIDSDLSRIAPAVDDEGKGILRLVQMGGNLAGNEIADFNEDVNRTCQYCKAAISTQDHIRWECIFFASTRDEIDAGLAKIPHKCLPACLRNGIAPAMKADGTKTFWGTDLDDQLNREARKLLGENLELHTPGSDGNKNRRKKSCPRNYRR